MEAAIPLKNFARDAEHIPPHDGDVWRLNLQRLGGIANAQASTWSPLPEGIRSFHTPDAFGSVRFLNKPPRRRQMRLGLALHLKLFSRDAKFITAHAQCAMGKTARQATAGPRWLLAEDICAPVNRRCSTRSRMASQER